MQGSIYGRRDHCQSEYDFKHSEPEICNFYVQKIKIIMVFIINYNVPSIWSWKPKKMTGKRVFSTENFDRNNPIETGSLRKFFVKQSVHSSKIQVTLIAIPLYAMWLQISRFLNLILNFARQSYTWYAHLHYFFCVCFKDAE